MPGEADSHLEAAEGGACQDGEAVAPAPAVLRQAIEQALAALEIPYTRSTHPPVFTVEEAEQHTHSLPGGHTKNLFLRDKKGRQHYLVVVEASRRVDLKALRLLLGQQTLSFASAARLAALLGLRPGGVSPMGLVQDRAHAVQVVVEAGLWACSLLNVHAESNATTLTLASADLRRFLERYAPGWRTLCLPLPEAAPPGGG